MPRLGVLLVRAGALTEESVNRALAIQGFAGGRIGTLLIERGSVSEDDVGKALAEQHGCEYIPWRQLGSVSSTVTAALPAKFAIRHSAVPVELHERFLRIVLRDPANLRILDELFFVTGKKIVPATAPEVRIYQALEKYYGERRTPRFAILAEKLSRPTLSSVIKKPLPPPPDFSAPSMIFPGDPIPPTAAEADAAEVEISLSGRSYRTSRRWDGADSRRPKGAPRMSSSRFRGKKCLPSPPGSLPRRSPALVRRRAAPRPGDRRCLAGPRPHASPRRLRRRSGPECLPPPSSPRFWERASGTRSSTPRSRRWAGAFAGAWSWPCAGRASWDGPERAKNFNPRP